MKKKVFIKVALMELDFMFFEDTLIENNMIFKANSKFISM